jgi:ABC-type spermidine/putrescine transport system, permease component I
MPLYANVEKLDWSLVEAARDLYSGSWRVFRHAILPQTTPGLAVGVTLTFIPAMGMFWSRISWAGQNTCWSETSSSSSSEPAATGPSARP